MAWICRFGPNYRKVGISYLGQVLTRLRERPTPSLAARLLERVSRKQRTKLPGSGGILSPSSTVSFCVERMQNLRTRHFSFIPQLRNVLTSHARVGSAGFKRFKVDADSAYARKSCCRENARGAVVNRSELFAIYAGVVLIV